MFSKRGSISILRLYNIIIKWFNAISKTEKYKTWKIDFNIKSINNYTVNNYYEWVTQSEENRLLRLWRVKWIIAKQI